MQDLQHSFSDDKGAFWMSYEDMLDKFAKIERTRLFDATWSTTQQWTSVNVPYTADISQTEFGLVTTKDTPVVIVLSQLDDRYFTGLRGEYSFRLHVFLHKEGEDEYIVRSQGHNYSDRSVNIDLPDLEAGKYLVRIMLNAKRYWDGPDDTDEERAAWIPERVLRRIYKKRPEKFLQIARQHDFAYAKGEITAMDDHDDVAEPETEEKADLVLRPMEPEPSSATADEEAKAECKEETPAKTEDKPEASDDTTKKALAEPSSPTNSDDSNAAKILTPSSEPESPTKEAFTDDATAQATSKSEDKLKDPEVKDPEVKDPKIKNPGAQDPVDDRPTPDDADDAKPAATADHDEQDADLAKNPWNAVCVVGLRVHSKDKECSIKIIQPRLKVRKVSDSEKSS